MSHQLAQLLFLGRRLTASAIVLLLIACMASGVGAYPAASGAEAAPAAALRPAPLSTTCPSYNFDLVFSYTDTELLFGNNVSEARFQAYRAPDMNGPFSPVDSVVDTDANTVTVTGVTQLSWWGLIGRGPQLYLPLVLHQ